MKIVATTSLPAVDRPSADRPSADRWNAARSRQKQGMMSQTGVITFPTFNDTDFNIVIQIEESSLLLCHFEGS